MDVGRAALLGVTAVVVVAVVGTFAYLVATPDATTSEAAELFDAPEVGDGAVCFRSSAGDGGFLTSVDARDPGHTVRYFRTDDRRTRITHYRDNDTTVTVSNFHGERAESGYGSYLNRVQSAENTTVVADDERLRVRAVERNDTVPSPAGGGRMLLLPVLETLQWERINATAYRPVGGFVRTDGPEGSNRTAYVDWARGVVRTDGNGSIRSVDLVYGFLGRVQHTFEVLYREPTPIRVSFDRSVCRPEPIRPPETG